MSFTRFSAVAALIATMLSVSLADIIVTKTQITSVLGSEGPGKIVYVKKSDTYSYFIDFSASTLTEKKVCSVQALAPQISPDGNALLFWSGEGISSASDCNTNTGTMYACDLAEGATPVNLGAGFNPHWWIDPTTGYTYVVYHTQGCKFNYPQPGETRKQRIDPDTYAKIGSSTLLLDKSFTGGLSKNGRYLCTAYNKVYMYDLQAGAVHTLNDGNQGCNPSICPSDDPTKQDRMMHLLLAATIEGTDYASHETFGVRDIDDNIVWYIPMPPQTSEWQNPEWSTHENFAVATANRSDEYNVYLVKMDSKSILRIVDGDNQEPHLWVQGAAPAPDINLNESELDFVATAGGSDPASQTVTVTAVNDADLSGISASETAAWLSVGISGTGDTRTLTNSITLGSLTKGTYTATVTVEADGASKTYDVTLNVTGGLPLTINVGDNTVSGWDSDVPYATGDNFYTSDYTISTTGVTDAGPADMYKTCRHQGPSFDFDLPDATYTVRLHFCEPHVTSLTEAGDRNMDVNIEDVTVLSSFNPGIAAGAVQKAYVYETTVTVSDGNGLDIDLINNGGDAFIMGIEIMSSTGIGDIVSAPPAPRLAYAMLSGGYVSFGLPAGAEGTVRIRSLHGQTVRELPAARRMVWDGRDSSGGKVRPGVYVVTAKIDGQVAAMRMTVVR